jgi:two-component system LytT family response regulator
MKAVNRIITIGKQDKLMLSVANSFRLVELEDINHLESWGSYTKIYLTNNKKIVTATGLTVYEELLGNRSFFRVNKSSLVNLNQIESYSHKKKTVKLKNNRELEVSRRKQKPFVNAIYERTTILPTSSQI